MSTVPPHRPSFNPHPLALVAASFAAGILLARLSHHTFYSLLSGGLATCSPRAFKRGR